MTRLPVHRSDLLTRSLGSETVIVDSVDNTAHALSPTAAAVFALCDGETTVSAAASTLSLPVADVESAVVTLTSLGLVAGAGMTRRVAIQRASLIGGGALVATVAAPFAAAHASGTPVRSGPRTTTVGATSAAPEQDAGDATNQVSFYFAQTSDTVTSYVVPFDGTITDWSTNVPAGDGGEGTAAALVVFRPGVSTTVVGSSDTETLSLGVNTFPTSIDVLTGDILGIYGEKYQFAHGPTVASANAAGEFAGKPADGSTATFDYPNNAIELNISATLTEAV